MNGRIVSIVFGRMNRFEVAGSGHHERDDAGISIPVR